MVTTKKRQPLRGWQKGTHGDQFFSCTYCRVQYNKETKILEIMKGEFVGECKCHGDAEAFNDDDR